MFTSKLYESETSLFEGPVRVHVELSCLCVLAFLKKLVSMETS